MKGAFLELLGPIHFPLVHAFGSMFSGILSMCGCNHQSPRTSKAKPRAAAFSRWIFSILETVVKVRATKIPPLWRIKTHFMKDRAGSGFMMVSTFSSHRTESSYCTLPSTVFHWWFCIFAIHLHLLLPSSCTPSLFSTYLYCAHIIKGRGIWT